MKSLLIILFAFSLAFVVGCDEDSNGDSTVDSQEPPTDPGDVPDTGPEIIVTDSRTILPTEGDSFPFNIYETGVIEARVEWSSGPSKLGILLCHNSLVCVSQPPIQSPAILQMQATRDLLDNSNIWGVLVNNDSIIEAVTVDCTVTFTPD